MKIETMPVYTCEFCGKKQFRKSDMTKHEKWCKHNPNNQHACFKYCNHLIREEEYYGTGESDCPSGKKTIFTCALTNQTMYSFIAERRKLGVVTEGDTVRMPLECDKYDGSGDTESIYYPLEGITERAYDLLF